MSNTNSKYCTSCGGTNSSDAKFCTSCGIDMMKGEPNGQSESIAKPITSDIPINLSGEFLKTRISLSHAYIGVCGGFALFLFSMFFPWVTARIGISVNDGGESSGWAECAYLSAIPLLVIAYPIIIRKATELMPTFICVGLALSLLISVNIVNRSRWAYRDYDYGSSLGLGFWFGLISLVAISVSAISWALHTQNKDTK